MARRLPARALTPFAGHRGLSAAGRLPAQGALAARRPPFLTRRRRFASAQAIWRRRRWGSTAHPLEAGYGAHWAGGVARARPLPQPWRAGMLWLPSLGACRCKRRAASRRQLRHRAVLLWQTSPGTGRRRRAPREPCRRRLRRLPRPRGRLLPWREAAGAGRRLRRRREPLCWHVQGPQREPSPLAVPVWSVHSTLRRGKRTLRRAARILRKALYCRGLRRPPLGTQAPSSGHPANGAGEEAARRWRRRHSVLCTGWLRLRQLCRFGTACVVRRSSDLYDHTLIATRRLAEKADTCAKRCALPRPGSRSVAATHSGHVL